MIKSLQPGEPTLKVTTKQDRGSEWSEGIQELRCVHCITTSPPKALEDPNESKNGSWAASSLMHDGGSRKEAHHLRRRNRPRSRTPRCCRRRLWPPDICRHVCHGRHKHPWAHPETCIEIVKPPPSGGFSPLRQTSRTIVFNYHVSEPELQNASQVFECCGDIQSCLEHVVFRYSISWILKIAHRHVTAVYAQQQLQSRAFLQPAGFGQLNQAWLLQSLQRKVGHCDLHPG